MFIFNEAITLLLFIFISIQRAGSSFDFADFISPEDLRYFSRAVTESSNNLTSTTPEGHWMGYKHWPEEIFDDEISEGGLTKEEETVDCFGLSGLMNTFKWFLDLKPLPSEYVYTRFYLTTRKIWKRVEIPTGDQFGLEWTDFDPSRPTIVIIHGFLSHSNASWVKDLTAGFLYWKNVNVLTVDWSKGGQTWKYWRAVANTRTVGTDIKSFLVRLMASTGCQMKDFHFVGHSLGAHICSYAASRLGGVGRITGLDPAQPCFRTTNKDMLLDPSDATYVDVIHTNGRLISKIGFGLPDPSGHADFYPNGGMKQPGCFKEGKKSLFYKYFPMAPERLYQAICSHGRAYLLFTESLINKNCSFIAHKWNMSYDGINSSFTISCARSGENCGVMGIDAYNSQSGQRSIGQFYVVTKANQPFCTLEQPKHENRHYLISDLLDGHRLNILQDDYKSTNNAENLSSTVTGEYP